MNNNITEDYCSFKVSKLLKKKGAELQTHYSSLSRSLVWWWKYGNELHGYNWFGDFDNMLPAPTHALAIKWIRENFGYNIEVSYRNADKAYQSISHPIFPKTKIGLCGNYNSNEEAIEAALLYTLKNLI